MKKVAIIVVSLVGLALTSQAGATPHFLPHGAHLSVKQKVAYFERSIHKDQTAIVFLTGKHAPRTLQRVSDLRWYRAATRWHNKLLVRYKAKLAPTVNYWINRQIAIAEIIGAASGGDPWPNCPDPFDGGGSWYDTVKCENRGMYERYGFPRAWYDSPGYYRCGLQFDPGWEVKYGRLCP